MSKILVTEQYLKDIANSLREKLNTNTNYKPYEMAEAVLSISSNGNNIVPNIEALRVTPSEEEQVFTAEGNVTGYSPVIVEAVDMPELPQWTTDGRLYYKNMIFPEGTEIIGGDNVNSMYRGINEIESVVMPDSVTSIVIAVFYGCKGLKNVTFGKNLTSVGQTAFRDCTAIETVDLINTSLTTLNTWAFRGCTSLTTVALPNTLTYDNGSFKHCNNLKNVTLQDGFLCTIDFSASTKYSVETIVNMFNALGVVPEGETRTLTLGATNLAKLTDEQKLIATNKGWTLSS